MSDPELTLTADAGWDDNGQPTLDMTVTDLVTGVRVTVTMLATEDHIFAVMEIGHRFGEIIMQAYNALDEARKNFDL